MLSDCTVRVDEIKLKNEDTDRGVQKSLRAEKPDGYRKRWIKESAALISKHRKAYKENVYQS